MPLATILTVVVTISALFSMLVALAVIYLYISALVRGETTIAAEGGG